jgi:SAM-dependent methyltransferase
MYDFYNGSQAYEVVEREDGFMGLSPGPRYYFAPYKDWPAHQKRALRLARGRVLDVGCGAGRVALHLQAGGLDVTGIDVSPLAVKVCRLRGVKKARVMSITRVGPKLGQFDTVVMMGNNFGLFGSLKRARWLLRRFRRTTSEQARMIAETTDPYQTDRRCHLAYHRLNRRRGRMAGQLRLRVRYESYATPWFDYLLVSRDEMRRILDGTGWVLKRTIDADGAPYVALIEKQP